MSSPPHPWRERPWPTLAAAVVVLLGSGWLALIEVFWSPLRVGGVLVPLSLALAVVGNLWLPGVARRLSGSRAVAVLPALVWITVALAATIRRPEGDLVLLGGGVTGAFNLAFLLLGAAAAAVGTARVVGARSRRAPIGAGGRLGHRPDGGGTVDGR